MWCVAELNDEYVLRMNDVLELYEREYEASEPVVCLDERPVQLHDEKRTEKPAAPGKPRRYDYEYVRCGTANIFCVVEPLAGRHMAKATQTRSGVEFAKVLGELANRYRKADTIHLVMDNLSTHSKASLERHYGQERGQEIWNRFTIHYTPKHASWLNQAEIEICMMNRQSLRGRRFPTLAQLRDHVGAWVRATNAARTRIDWRFTREKARLCFGLEATETKLQKH